MLSELFFTCISVSCCANKCISCSVKVEVVAEKELQSLHDAVYDQALIWVNSLKEEQKERIVEHFGRMPEKDSEPQVNI